MGSMYHSFCIHPSTDGPLSCLQILVFVNNTALNTGMHMFFQISVSGFFIYIPEVESLGHKALAFTIFQNNSILLSTVAAPVCILTSSSLGFPFPHILARTCCLLIYEW